MFAGHFSWSSMARVLVGTSGWSYASWRGPFFPMDLPAKRHLECQFETVELNGVFYRTPTTESVADLIYLRGHGPRGRYEGHTHLQRLLPGANPSSFGNAGVATSMSISTTTEKAPRQLTRLSYAACLRIECSALSLQALRSGAGGAGAVSPVEIITMVETMQGVIEAYQSFDRREPASSSQKRPKARVPRQKLRPQISAAAHAIRPGRAGVMFGGRPRRVAGSFSKMKRSGGDLGGNVLSGSTKA